MVEVLEAPPTASGFAAATAAAAHTPETCKGQLDAVRDALYVVNGKWKLPLIIALSQGPQRFSDLERAVTGITPKLLSKELKELEINGFLTRTVYPTIPVRVEYELAQYADTLQPVIQALAEWGYQHRQRVMGRD